jgi:hypothetical protein
MTINQNMTDNPHYVTPVEAREVGCPLSMAGNPHIAHKSCLGPNCMAWRWEMKPSMLINWAATKYQPDPQPHWIRIGDHPYKDAIDRKSGQFIEGTGKGYCGMVRS